MATQPDETRFPVPIVSAIIERRRNGQTEILLQTRWKPHKDPKYSGALELPAGTMEKGESVYETLRREVYEETGLRVTSFRPDIHTQSHSQRGDVAFAFRPFCCQQQTSELNRVGFVFICTVEAGEPTPAPDEAKDAQWINKDELRRLLAQHPEHLFTVHLGVLDLYLNYPAN